jgi:glutaminase
MNTSITTSTTCSTNSPLDDTLSQNAHHDTSPLLEIFDHLVLERGICSPGCMTIGNVIDALKEEGIFFWRDSRFQESQQIALQMAHCTTTPTQQHFVSPSPEDQEAAAHTTLDCDGFVRLVAPQAVIFMDAFSEQLVIPDWKTFVTDVTYHFDRTAPITDGQTAQYIPILRDANPNKWGLSMCSIDGQRFSIGDYETPFTLQSVSKPVTYALCLALEGEEEVDKWIGVEPAGRPFNTQDLEAETHIPFNASVNSGAIMAAGLFASNFPEKDWKQCVDKIRQAWSDLSGNDLDIGFSQETYESEKETAYNNIAIAYNLKGRRGLPRDVSIHTMLDVYLGCCSIEMTAESLAVAAATFANGGVCPITRKEVFPAHVVRHVLSETMTCGMYDQAGRFAVHVGLPAKSGVSGALMVIVPNLMGFCTFSPRLNKKGNSVRGLEFCKGLVHSYRVHIFEPLRSGNCAGKIDPRINGKNNEYNNMSHIALAYQVGDAWAIQLREIFLHSMIHVGFASEAGLSERMIKGIQDEYQLIYHAPLDEASLQAVIDAVSVDPTDMRLLEKLKKDRFISDDFRNVISFAIMELIALDGKLTDKKEAIALDICVFLGLDRDIARMTLNRHHNQVGPRFKESDPFDGVIVKGSPLRGSSLRASSSSSSFPSLPSNSDFGGTPTMVSLVEDADVDVEQDLTLASEAPHVSSRMASSMSSSQEVLQLRRENYLLKKRLDAATALLHEARSRRIHQSRRLSMTREEPKAS